MNGRELLIEHFERISDEVAQVIADLDERQLTARPAGSGNSIAWLVWHLSRVQDDHVAELAGVDQAWTRDGWADRFALELDPADTGYGHSADQVAAVRGISSLNLGAYHAAVHRLTLAYLGDVDEAELDRIVDRRWEPPVTAGVRLVSVIGDALQHLGQAAYVAGLP